MELKFRTPLQCWRITDVLIVPLWNRNVVVDEEGNPSNDSLNRTIMELKLRFSLDQSFLDERLNRTIMELKSSSSSSRIICSSRLNRTIMELKFVIITTGNERGEVLIVPLWN